MSRQRPPHPGLFVLPLVFALAAVPVRAGARETGSSPATGLDSGSVPAGPPAGAEREATGTGRALTLPIVGEVAGEIADEVAAEVEAEVGREVARKTPLGMDGGEPRGGDADPLRPGSPLAVTAALVPGLLLHGSGHFALGDRETAKTLLVAEGIGLGTFIAGMVFMAATGGSEKVAPLYVVPAVGGASAFVVSWLADVAGAAHGTGPLAHPWRPQGRLYLGAGYAGLFASPFAFTHDLTLSASWYGDRWWSSLSALADPRGRYGGAANRLGLRLWRPEGDPVDEISAVLLLGHQRFGSERFGVTTGALYAEGRFNLRRVGPSLRNAWVRTRLGAGYEGYRYDAGGAWDGLPQIVFGVGFGLQVHPAVGVELGYWQAKNELPGGLVVPGGLDGFFGMAELSGRVRLTEDWALLPGVRYGAGVMPWLSVEARAW